MRNTPSATVAGLVASVVLALPLAACSTPDEQTAAPETPSSPAPTVQEAPALTSLGEVTLGTVIGRLPRKQRDLVLRDVSATVDTWLTRAYLRGPWPRNDFHDAFWAFTRGAQVQAAADRRLLSNAGSGYGSVTPLKRRIAVDVIAAGQRPAGATARVRLVFKTSAKRPVVVRGRVFLTRAGQKWRIFGYDVSRGQA